MNRSRIGIIVAVLATFGVVALGWFVGAEPQLSQVNLANQERAAVEIENALHQAEIERLAEAADDLQAVSDEYYRARASVPVGIAEDEIFDQLSLLVPASGVTLVTVTIGDATLYGTEAAAGPEAGSEGAQAGTGVSNLAGPVASSTYSIPVSITVTGSFEQLRSLLTLVQTGTRLVLITDASFSAIEDEGSLTISGFVFALADGRQPNLPAASGSSPVPTPAPTSTETPAPESTETPAP